MFCSNLHFSTRRCRCCCLPCLFCCCCCCCRMLLHFCACNAKRFNSIRFVFVFALTFVFVFLSHLLVFVFVFVFICSYSLPSLLLLSSGSLARLAHVCSLCSSQSHVAQQAVHIVNSAQYSSEVRVCARERDRE